MPYSPQAYDRTGDYKAAGILEAGRALGSGLSEGLRAYRQNKIMSGQAIAKFDAIRKTSPDIDKFLTDPSAPPDVAKAYKKLMKDGNVGIKDAAILATFADTHLQQKQEAEMRKLRELQTQVAQQQVQAGQQQLDEGRSRAEQVAKFRQLGQFDQGAGTGVLRPEVQQQMRGQLKNPGVRFGVDTVAATGQLPNPGDYRQFLEAQGSRPPTMGVDQVQAQFPSDKFDATMVPTGVPGQVHVKSVSPRAPASDRTTQVPVGDKVLVFDRDGNVIKTVEANPAIPTGYERSPQGGIKPIAGGPAEIDAKKARMEQEAMKEKAKQSALSQSTTIAVMLNAIDEVVPKIGPSTAGIGAIIGALPGTPARDLAAKLDTLRANIGFQQLAQMRAASPTGGALGQVAVKELDFLQSALGNLDKWQSPKQLKETLGKIRTHIERWQQTLQGINPDEGEKTTAAQPPPGWSLKR